jgi:hypothetical protein
VVRRAGFFLERAAGFFFEAGIWRRPLRRGPPLPC